MIPNFFSTFKQDLTVLKRHFFEQSEDSYPYPDTRIQLAAIRTFGVLGMALGAYLTISFVATVSTGTLFGIMGGITLSLLARNIFLNPVPSTNVAWYNPIPRIKHIASQFAIAINYVSNQQEVEY